MKRGLIGKNISYSYSKEIHEFLTKKDYEIFNINEEELESFILKKDYSLLNVTIPYKKEVIKYLDDVDDVVLKTGVCNTIINEHGKIRGYNTDVSGFERLLKYYKIDLKNKNVLILGTGATSNSVAYCLEKNNVKKYYKVSRNGELTYQNIYDNIDLVNSIDIIINTTPVGTNGYLDELLIDLEKFNNASIVIDCIYNPYHTNLLNEAKRLKKKYYNGLIMLVYQAAESSGICDLMRHQLKFINKAYLNVLLNHVNIVLIGMPGVGKTTIGRDLAKIFQLQYIDLDKEFEDYYHIKPNEEIIKNGEDAFRLKEAELVQSFNYPPRSLISTGGGIVEEDGNYLPFMKNSIIFYLNRIPSSFTLNKKRPLTSNIDEWNAKYKIRKALYEKWSDYKIKCDRLPQETINYIVSVIKEI